MRWVAVCDLPMCSSLSILPRSRQASLGSLFYFLQLLEKPCIIRNMPEIYFDVDARCQGCKKQGAFVYYTGDIYCFDCMSVKVEIVIPISEKEISMDSDSKTADKKEEEVKKPEKKIPPHFVLKVNDSVLSPITKFEKKE